MMVVKTIKWCIDRFRSQTSVQVSPGLSLFNKINHNSPDFSLNGLACSGMDFLLLQCRHVSSFHFQSCKIFHNCDLWPVQCTYKYIHTHPHTYKLNRLVHQVSWYCHISLFNLPECKFWKYTSLGACKLVSTHRLRPPSADNIFVYKNKGDDIKNKIYWYVCFLNHQMPAVE